MRPRDEVCAHASKQRWRNLGRGSDGLGVRGARYVLEPMKQWICSSPPPAATHNTVSNNDGAVLYSQYILAGPRFGSLFLLVQSATAHPPHLIYQLNRLALVELFCSCGIVLDVVYGYGTLHSYCVQDQVHLTSHWLRVTPCLVTGLINSFTHFCGTAAKAHSMLRNPPTVEKRGLSGLPPLASI
jgi:hypothetical protein